MNACCPTSPPCRRTGVLRMSPPQHPAVRQYSVLLLFLFLSRAVCVCRGPVEREGEPRRRFRLPVVRRHQPETHGDAEAHLQDTPQVQKHIHAAPIPETTAFRETERVCKCQLDGLSVSFNFYSCLIFKVFNLFFCVCKYCFSACAGPQHDRPSASVEEQVRLARLPPPLTISQMRNVSREQVCV